MNLVYSKIQSEQDLSVYLSKVSLFKEIYPFYKIISGYLKEQEKEQLCYFTLEENGNVLILMPFILREINHKVAGETYFDVVSPYGYSGPLYDQNLSRAYLLEFWKLVDQWYQENDVVCEFIRFSLNNNYQFYSGKLVPTLSNVKGHIIQDEKKQWDAFKSKVRNNYRKAVSNGLRFEINQDSTSLKHVENFYQVYIKTMTRIGAAKEYFYSLDYFKNIIKRNSDNYALAFVYKDDVIISVELILILRTTLYSYLGGTLSDYFNYRPNDFLKIEVMNWARKEGHEYYVLGGGREDNDNLYHYKKTFFPNDSDVIFYTGRKVVNTQIYKALDVAFNGPKEKGKVKSKTSSKVYFPIYRKA
ncbi:GNAT family N-acetyltransferase [Algibacter sp. L4_22]|uniref:GNAT family N-acetyltransferase n=1 Tax=Algibacter sp. L4_22 TaxID=2942477 RepID=UPI00201B9398|nr:GNAT family N-acetyltransferase [Algibacter sp. L4_22]MCL5127868.1 GNAT family N-acetyltransferase [Algibacter sp. L4_22]